MSNESLLTCIDELSEYLKQAIYNSSNTDDMFYKDLFLEAYQCFDLFCVSYKNEAVNQCGFLLRFLFYRVAILIYLRNNPDALQDYEDCIEKASHFFNDGEKNKRYEYQWLKDREDLNGKKAEEYIINLSGLGDVYGSIKTLLHKMVHGAFPNYCYYSSEEEPVVMTTLLSLTCVLFSHINSCADDFLIIASPLFKQKNEEFLTLVKEFYQVAENNGFVSK